MFSSNKFNLGTAHPFDGIGAVKASGLRYYERNSVSNRSLHANQQQEPVALRRLTVCNVLRIQRKVLKSKAVQ